MREPGATIRVLQIPSSPGLADTVGVTFDPNDERIELRTAATAEDGLELVAEGEVD